MPDAGFQLLPPAGTAERRPRLQDLVYDLSLRAKVLDLLDPERLSAPIGKAALEPEIGSLARAPCQKVDDAHESKRLYQPEA
jgi:hypothetical protein